MLAGGKPVLKPGTLIDSNENITVLKKREYVSRGGYKLAHALRQFKISVQDKVVLDVGSSTGGFTDCLLKNGARLVVAVDVGRGQLDWSLRNDPRVRVVEGTNIRNLKPPQLPELAGVATVDVSFISVTKFTQNLLSLLTPLAEIIVLIKPQFEAAPKLVGRKGVVRDPDTHRQVLLSIWRHYAEQGLAIKGLTPSPIRGAQGNREFLLHIARGEREGLSDPEAVVEKIIKESYHVNKDY